MRSVASHRRVRCTAGATAVLAALLSVVITSPSAQAAPITASLALSKGAFVSGTSTLLTGPVTPGGSFDYQLASACSGLTQGCINAQTVDVLPPGVIFNGADSSPLYTVTYTAATRTVTVAYNDALLSPPNPAGSHGMFAGSTRTAVLHVTLDPATPAPDGSKITNTATDSADNATSVSDSADITVSVPRRVTPLATKSMAPSSLVAQSGASTTATLGVRNASSTSADVSSLTVADTTKATWDDFDLSSVGPVSEFPTGADEVSVQYCTSPAPCTAGQFVAGPFVPGPDLALPNGVDPTTVTGLQFVFQNSAGLTLPVSTTAGSVPIGLTLRDTVRSTGAALDPATALTQQNCAAPSATDAVLGSVAGTAVCANFTVQPGTVQVSAAKQFFPDANGSYSSNGYAVTGQSSGVTALSKVSNTSAFTVPTLTITDPSASVANNFADVDVTGIKLVFPAGATSAVGTTTCGDGSTVPFAAAANTTLVAGCPVGSPPTGVTVTYSGTIAAGATAQLGLHGTLNGGAAGGTTINDCTDATIPPFGQHGAASATGCAPLPVENPRTTVGGVKSSSSPGTGGALVPGQPIAFTVQATNSGNLPQTGFTITDPDPASAAPNPFAVVRISPTTTATVTTSPGSLAANFAIEVLDGTTWVPYVAGDTALLTRATGIRARQISGLVQPTNRVSLNFAALVRDTVPTGATLTNCQRTNVTSVAGSGNSGDVCAPTLTVAAAAAAGQVNKLIAPASVPAPLPGVVDTAQVQLKAQNTGNLPMNKIVIVDPDPTQDTPDTFFDSVTVTTLSGVNFPPGANQVQVDACTSAADCRNGIYTLGNASATASLPVAAANVAGLRFTFSNSSNGFVLNPGSNFPTTGACRNATVCFSVVPRTTLRSAPGTTISYPATFTNIATASGGNPLTNGNLVSFGSAPASLSVTAGNVQLSPVKTAAPTNVSPGSTIVYTLATTNSGTAAVPALTVVEPIPAGLVFDSTFSGDGGLPYTMNVTVPAGTPAPPRPIFTPVVDPATNLITQLTWQFPESYDFLPTSVISFNIQATLAPGTAAGTPVQNTYGASTADPNVLAGLACRIGTPDPTLGCTASAQVIAGSGSAVDAQKWVHGDDSRGFYNSQTKAFVPIGDASCPLLVVDGNDYTRFPCVALVTAGQNFNFLLNLTNAGTTPLTQTRLVNDLPRVGDTGVIVPSPRGTEWAPSPSLAGPPTIADGLPGTLALSYSNSSPGCVLDLSLPPGTCPASAWADPLTPAVQSFRGFITFSTPLAPAQSTRLIVPMSAPADLDTSSNQLPIAWNSFAHTDFFRQTNGAITQLRAVEPIRVGVAMPFGTLEIAKQVTGDIPPGSLIGPFRGTYSCVVTTAAGAAVTVAQGSAVFSADAPFVVAHVPVGAVCSVVETDTGGGNVTQPAPVTITPDVDTALPSPTISQIVNDFPAPRLIVTKAIDGAAAADAVGPFVVTVDCTLGSTALPPRTLTFDAAGSQSITDLPIGAVCTVAEPDTRGATSTSTVYSDGDHASINALIDGVATLTNTYDPIELTVSKNVVGPGSPGPYSFAAVCTLTTNTGAVIEVPLAPEDAAFTLSSGGTRGIAVPSGSQCTVTETSVPTGDTVTYDGQPIAPTVDVSTPVAVAIVNNFVAAGSGSGGAAGEGTGGSDLASTGDNVLTPLLIGSLLVAAGLGFVLTGRRRPRRPV